ncbi:MAG TPA: NYN domain-containing protein [Actinomycetota bacterium]|nr:NYN domain-containing protein [Actinomycetota bacterium]
MEREREKTRQARAEARRAKEEARTEIADARAQIAQLQAELEKLGTLLAAAEGERDGARRQLDKAAAESEGALRRARRDLERAHAEIDELRRALREEKRKVAATVPKPAKERLAGRGRARVPSEPEAEVATGPRSPLPVPLGRLADDPETLLAWLDTPRVHLLVDGYNVAKAEGGYGDLELATQRERVVDGVARVARKKKIAATVVFDGSDVTPGTLRRSARPVKVEYSAPGQIADDHLVVLLEKLPSTPVVVVTNDRELQERARALGATIATSEQLLALIR